MTVRPLLILLALSTACSDSPMDVDTGTDAGADTAIDTAVEDSAALDTGIADAGTDTAMDAESDADVDAGDAGVDASEDSAVDMGSDTSLDAAPSRSALTINEIRASGDDWVELYYFGEGTLSIAGLQITDADDDGGPRTDRAVVIPDGVEIASGEYFVIVADQDDTSTMLETECGLEGVDRCVFSDWGMSAGGGDTVFLLDEEGEELESAVYPPDAIGEAPDATWARDIDGEGEFVVSVPTPNAPNMPLM